jgi:hypothetical protein
MATEKLKIYKAKKRGGGGNNPQIKNHKNSHEL